MKRNMVVTWRGITHCFSVKQTMIFSGPKHERTRKMMKEKLLKRRNDILYAFILI